jgi:hypothetical protein
MKKIILTLAITALSVIIATPTQAAPKSVHPSGVHATAKVNHVNAGKFNNYHVQHGTKFDHGFFYKGKNHNHWGLTRFDPRYGCTCYWDTTLRCWYYWCERDICYYPVSYCPYRCYSCTEVVQVVAPVCQTCQPVTTCDTCTSGLQFGIGIGVHDRYPHYHSHYRQPLHQR